MRPDWHKKPFSPAPQITVQYSAKQRSHCMILVSKFRSWLVGLALFRLIARLMPCWVMLTSRQLSWIWLVFHIHRMKPHFTDKVLPPFYVMSRIINIGPFMPNIRMALPGRQIPPGGQPPNWWPERVWCCWTTNGQWSTGHSFLGKHHRIAKWFLESSGNFLVTVLLKVARNRSRWPDIDFIFFRISPPNLEKFWFKFS